MKAKPDHEDEALLALCVELRLRGHLAELVCHPDREDHPLTVDAIIRVDGREWAVDHCLVSRPPQLPPAMLQAERALKERLDEVARRHGCDLFVQYTPIVRGARQSPAEIARWYDDLADLATKAAALGEPLSGEDGDTLAWPAPSDDPGVVLAPIVSGATDIFLGSQVEAGLQAPLVKKLTGQLRKAKDAGFPVALLLDQVPRPDVRNRTIMIATPVGIGQVVGRILDQYPGIVDQVWLRTAPPLPDVVLLLPG